jgi:hypothetical protein
MLSLQARFALGGIVTRMPSPIPFYVIAFNRIRGLREADEFIRRSTIPLELIILDMGSTWKPFIEYRDSLNAQVLHFPYGMGPRDLWVSCELSRIGLGGFFLADGDIDYSEVPADAAAKMICMSNRYPWFPKVGLALKITDLPLDHEGRRIRAWAKGDWAVKWDKETFLTGLDTTIAYYPRRETTFHYRPGLRIAGLYQAIHYPWYEREQTYDEEAKFYVSIASEKISSAQAALMPSANFRAKRLVLILLYHLLKYPLKSRILGGICVRVLSYRGTLKPKTVS